MRCSIVVSAPPSAGHPRDYLLDRLPLTLRAVRAWGDVTLY
ncbi:hypothetical protein [Nocardia abscessus]|nr:hypothetical protein [Nocardia abscessus]